MPIKFKSIERGQPGVPGGGDKKFYAHIVYDGEMTVDKIVKRIEKFSALSEADIHGVIIAMENVIRVELSDSRIVRMDKLGTFYPLIKSGPSDTAEEVSNQNIARFSVRYRPGQRILNTMRDAGFKKESAAVIPENTKEPEKAEEPEETKVTKAKKKRK